MTPDTGRTFVRGLGWALAGALVVNAICAGLVYSEKRAAGMMLTVGGIVLAGLLFVTRGNDGGGTNQGPG